tara:strand:+ start:830 stop:1189 length:360 start_codon:yes stop_codon:yes gene_type:complete
MTRERIDLTRFEGHTKGEWCIDDGNLMVRTGEISVRLAEPFWDDGITEDEDTINKKLMISGPDLLAELKRCYEKLDMAESALTEIWAHQIDNVGGYNVTEILLYYEKAHGLNIRPDASE